MATPRAGSFPAAAISWLAPARRGRVLAIGADAAPVLARLAALGNEITVADRSEPALHDLVGRRPSFRAVAATADSLPFAPCSFDAVLVHEGMHQLPPGLALAEFARVLVPGGRLTTVATVRDDSVPWVRRLADILRRHDPEAMRPAHNQAGSIPEAVNFPLVERREFRRWVPISRPEMLEMVAQSPRLASLDLDQTKELLAEVGALYDSSARAPEPLLLPYAVRCARAEVDHAELSSMLRAPADGLQISLQSPPEWTANG